MKSNIVGASAFDERGAHFGRLDAEFVDPDMLELEAQLSAKHGAKPLASLMPAEVENYVRPKVSGSQVRTYVAIDDIDAQDGFLFHQSLPEDELPGRAKYKLKPFDILISNVRPERGAVGLVLSAQEGAIGSSGLTVVRIGDEQSRNVVFAYLRSRYARIQLVRRSRGSMYPAITKDDIPEVLIPTFSADDIMAIGAKVAESIICRDRFFELYQKQNELVEEYLAETLGEPPPDIVLEVAKELPLRIAKHSELSAIGANRFDAEFHRKEFVEFEARLKSTPDVFKLGSAFEAFAGGNPSKGDGTVNRLRQAQLSGFGISYAGCEEIENAKAPTRFAIKAGDVLIGCTAHEPHYVGNRVDLIDDLPELLFGSLLPVPDVMIIRGRNKSATATAPFLASFLRTKWGRRQFQRLNRGVRGGHVYGQDVEAFVYVPRPPVAWMAGFSDRLEEIRAARRGSIAAVAHAVARVESALV